MSRMLAAGADLRWVQSQVGHEDAKMTLDVYSQVLQRKDRELYTEAFDRLMADAIPSSGAVKMAADPGREMAGLPPNRRPGLPPRLPPKGASQPDAILARIASRTKKPPQTRGSFGWS